ncbi:MAG: response regulator [Alphaproteobacteria bacterium]|nr:response regulator [Alphaproteobacteria bacterium]
MEESLLNSISSARLQADAHPVSKAPLLNEQFLIVDDDQFSLEVLSMILLKMGVGRPWKARNGSEAQQILEYQGNIGIVFLDIFMPQQDGMEFVQLDSLRIQNPAVILMTGKKDHTLSHATKLAKAYGVNVVGSIWKPIRSADIEPIVKPYICSEA